jgi:V/A-type H+-transporting ATPase subunit E
MAEELQSLLERIRREGLEKAEAEAEAVLAAARARADGIVKDAQAAAAELLKRAEQDGEAFAARGRQAVEQAARDLILSVRAAVEALFAALVQREVAQALTPEALQPMLAQVVETYVRGDADRRVSILLAPEALPAVLDFFQRKFAEELKRGLEVKSENGIPAGFRVSLADGRVQLEFTDEAIAEALCQLLRPHLAERVRRGLKEEPAGPRT